MKWVTGFNMPGYMPDPDSVGEHESWTEARDSLIETIESHMDSDSGGAGDAVWNAQVDAIDTMRLAKPDRPTGVSAGQFVYWIEIKE